MIYRMKVCSFDVGIVHLAYCIINKQMNNFTIENWGVINIDENIINCSHIIKQNKQCNKKATFALKLNNNIKIRIMMYNQNYVNDYNKYHRLHNNYNSLKMFSNYNNIDKVSSILKILLLITIFLI